MNATANATEEDAFLSPFLIFQAAVTVFLVILTEVGNILTLIVVIKYKSLRKKSFLFIPSLAAADALAGLGVAINSIQAFEEVWCPNYLGGTLTVMATTFGLFLSHLHIKAMAVDRFVAITFPFQYDQWITVRRIYITIAVIWISGVAYILTLLSWGWEDPEEQTSCGGYNIPINYIVWTSFPLFLVTLLTLVVTYSKIFRVAKRKVITVDPVPVTSVASIEQRTQMPRISRTDAEQRRQSPHNGKVSKYIGAVIGAYILTWAIFFASRIGRVAKPAVVDDTTYYIIAALTLNIALSNSTLNVFIYACFLSEFREAYKKLLCCTR